MARGLENFPKINNQDVGEINNQDVGKINNQGFRDIEVMHILMSYFQTFFYKLRRNLKQRIMNKVNLTY